MPLPLVSVLMTVYNREKYIAEAIESVLQSTYTNFELIIVDDCSTDTSVEIAKSYEAKDKRIKVYVNEKNVGDYPNRNRAATYANGKYIKYLDSDDIIYPHGLQVMVEAMERFPDAALGIAGTKIEDKAPYPYILTANYAYFRHFLVDGIFVCGPSGAIIKLRKFNDLGGFVEMRHLGDTDLWLRIGMENNVVILPPALLWWRKHDEQEIKIEAKNVSFQIERIISDMKFITTESNPLTELERKEALRLLKKRQLFNVLSLILKRKYRFAFFLFKATNISLKDILGSIKRNKYKINDIHQ